MGVPYRWCNIRSDWRNSWASNLVRGYVMGDKIVDFVLILFFTSMACILLGIGFLIIKQETSEKIYLLKDAWQCSSSREGETLVLVGKVLMPIKSKECIKYEKVE